MYVHVCAVVLYAFVCLISAFAVIDSIDVHLTRVIKFTYLINISMLLDCRGGVQPRVIVRKIVTYTDADNDTAIHYVNHVQPNFNLDSHLVYI